MDLLSKIFISIYDDVDNKMDPYEFTNFTFYFYQSDFFIFAIKKNLLSTRIELVTSALLAPRSDQLS